ncbi:MAG: HEAT repeat domain-containing protein [Planctomycetes bacterium]|nr:HEAT repeat domain-containing protein [Planctomycetota bacterium]
MVRTFGQILILALVLASAAPAEPPAEAQIAAAVAELGDDLPDVRIAARLRLTAWGKADPDRVLAKLPESHADPEVDASLHTVRNEISIAVESRDRRVDSLEHAGALHRKATLTLLDNLEDAAFLAPAERDPSELPTTDGVLTPFIMEFGADKPRAMRIMETCLASRRLSIRRIAIRILYYHGTLENRKDVRKALTDDDAYVRGAAAQALAKFGDREALADIRPLCKDAVDFVRYHGVLALRQLGDRECMSDLVALLENPEPQARAWAAGELEKEGFRWDPEAEKAKAAKRWWEESKKR